MVKARTRAYERCVCMYMLAPRAEHVYVHNDMYKGIYAGARPSTLAVVHRTAAVTVDIFQGKNHAAEVVREIVSPSTFTTFLRAAVLAYLELTGSIRS